MRAFYIYIVAVVLNDKLCCRGTNTTLCLAADWTTMVVVLDGVDG